MHLGSVRRMLEKHVKHASLVISQHFPHALSHHKCNGLACFFLNILYVQFAIHWLFGAMPWLGPDVRVVQYACGKNAAPICKDFPHKKGQLMFL